jgi:hypothetical protein
MVYDATYTCLSYKWKPEYPKYDIQMDGHTLSIGHDLYQFLETRPGEAR